jgi:hypothetical protein
VDGWRTDEGLPIPTPPSEEKLARRRAARALIDLFYEAARLHLSVMEDMLPATGAMEFDHDRGEWAFSVQHSYGYPRKTLGLLIIKLKDSGDLVTYLE